MQQGSCLKYYCGFVQCVQSICKLNTQDYFGVFFISGIQLPLQNKGYMIE